MTQRWFRLLAVLFAFTLIAAACGDDDSTTADEPADEPAEDEEPAEEPAEEPDEDAPGAFCSQISDGGDGEFAGETVTILGPETANEAEGFCASLVGVVDATGVAIDYTGTRDAAVQTNVAVEAGNLPSDIVTIPQPGRLAGFARDGLLTATPDPPSARMRRTPRR